MPGDGREVKRKFNIEPFSIKNKIVLHSTFNFQNLRLEFLLRLHSHY